MIAAIEWDCLSDSPYVNAGHDSSCLQRALVSPHASEVAGNDGRTNYQLCCICETDAQAENRQAKEEV